MDDFSPLEQQHHKKTLPTALVAFPYQSQKCFAQSLISTAQLSLQLPYYLQFPEVRLELPRVLRLHGGELELSGGVSIPGNAASIRLATGGVGL